MFLEQIFKALSSLFEAILNVVKRVLPYILLAAAAYLALCTGGISLAWLVPGTVIPSGWASAAVLAGASFILAPNETAAIVNSGVDAIGSVATNLATEAGQMLASVSEGVLGLPLWALVVGGVGLFLLFRNKGEKDVVIRPSPDQQHEEVSNGRTA